MGLLAGAEILRRLDGVCLEPARIHDEDVGELVENERVGLGGHDVHREIVDGAHFGDGRDEALELGGVGLRPRDRGRDVVGP